MSLQSPIPEFGSNSKIVIFYDNESDRLIFEQYMRRNCDLWQRKSSKRFGAICLFTFYMPSLSSSEEHVYFLVFLVKKERELSSRLYQGASSILHINELGQLSYLVA